MEGPEHHLTKTILEMDLVAYSDVARLLEENLNVEAVKALQDQIQHFVDHGLELMGLKRDDIVMATAGDNAILMFDDATAMHQFAQVVQACTLAHNASLSIDIAKRWFRMGAATGTILVMSAEHRIVGSTIARAVRLEAVAKIGQLVVDLPTFNSLPDELKPLYGNVEIIKGKRNERFQARRCTLIDAAKAYVRDQVENIARRVRVYRVHAADHPVANPPLLATGQERAGSAKRTSEPLPLPDKPSIAVLPFQNMSGDPEQEYFADGMVEEITTALSKVRWFFVIARNSTFAYKGRAVDVRQVAGELGVRYILEGSVRSSGNRVRISAQLIDGTTGNHVWAERYDRELADIFAVQDEITERVAASIEPQLYAAEHFRSRRKAPEKLDAWECVVRALSRAGQDTSTGHAEAEALYRRAIAIAPNYGQAHSLLAWTLVRRASRSARDLKVVLPEARVEAQTALDLDQLDPWAHMTWGVVLWRMRRHGEAERAYRRALELNPNFAVAHATLALVLAIQGGHKEAIEYGERALRLSPNDLLVSVYASVGIAAAHFAARRYGDATTWARQAIERSPEHLPAYFFLIGAATLKGERATAGEALTLLLRLQPHVSLAWMRQNMAYSTEVGHRLLQGLRKAGLPEE